LRFEEGTQDQADLIGRAVPASRPGGKSVQPGRAGQGAEGGRRKTEAVWRRDEKFGEKLKGRTVCPECKRRSDELES
jgi:hypothetical protein